MRGSFNNLMYSSESNNGFKANKVRKSMKLPAALYKTPTAEYLAVYNHWADISVKLHSQLSQGERIGHVDYSYGKRTKGIDLFLFREGLPKETPGLNVSKVIQARQVPEGLHGPLLRGPETDQKNDLHYQFVTGFDPTQLVPVIQTDVASYCSGKHNGKPAANPRGSSLVYVSKIIPVTTLERKTLERNGRPYILTGGKAEFVKACFLEANEDFGDGCVTGWIPGENASFDGKTFTDFHLAPWDECRYPCYAADKHSSFPKNLINLDPALLKKELMGDCCLEFGSDKPHGKPIRILRFGKRTECGSKYTLDMLTQSLEVMTETGTRGVMPTKFLEYNPTVADLLRRTNSAVLFSIGLDEEEPGAVAHGCTNAWRFEQAMKYREAGVNANLYLLIRGHLPPSERETDILRKTNSGSKLPIQLLPFITKSKEAAHRLLGLEWDLLKGVVGQGQLLGIAHNYADSYHLEGGKLRLHRLNPAWSQLTKDHIGIGICHHDPFETYCGGCGHCPKRVCETEEIPRTPRVRNNKRKAIKKKANEEPVDTKQLILI